MGIQDAYCKFSALWRRPGTWVARAINSEKGLLGIIYQEKWDKTRSMIKEIRCTMRDKEWLNSLRLEYIIEFLFYFEMKHREFNTYLKMGSRPRRPLWSHCLVSIENYLFYVRIGPILDIYIICIFQPVSFVFTLYWRQV